MEAKNETAVTAQFTKGQKIAVFSIREVADKTDKEKKNSFWLRVGRAFVNSDGSLNVQLDAMPLDGKLNLRIDLPKAERKHEGAEGFEAEAA